MASIEILVCYARKDEEFLQQLDNQLRALQQERPENFQVWYDRKIKFGAEWKQEIYAHLHTAQIILLLISPDFLASDNCRAEMKVALERHDRGEADVIPVIVRPVFWQDGPLGKLQALPKDGIPLTDHTWHSPDDAFFNVAEGIHHVLEERETQSSGSTPSSENLFANKKNKPRLKSPGKRELLVSVVILLALIFLSTRFISFPICFAASCPSQPSNTGINVPLSVTVLRVDSPAYYFQGDPERYAGGDNLPTD